MPKLVIDTDPGQDIDDLQSHLRVCQCSTVVRGSLVGDVFCATVVDAKAPIVAMAASLVAR